MAYCIKKNGTTREANAAPIDMPTDILGAASNPDGTRMSKVTPATTTVA